MIPRNIKATNAGIKRKKKRRFCILLWSG